MNLKINRESLSVSEKIYDGSQEQSVELDYILPDYYQDIFKMVKCTVYPSVTSYGINGETLTYELIADVKFLYCSEKNDTLHCINQRLTYSKSVNLGDRINNPVISICPKTDHINCRVVNKRRVDMRGAVSIRIKVCGESKQEAICDVTGMNMQTKKFPVEYMAKKINKTKNIILNENIELGDSKPPVISIIHMDVSLSEPEKKIIANKLVVKGDADIKILYTCTDGMETMNFSVPYSQIIDMEGLDESYFTSVKVEKIMEDISAASDSNDDNKLIKCEIKLNIVCCAYKTITVELVSDLYSTAYPCEHAVSKLAIEQPPMIICEKFQSKALLQNDENNILCVYDVRCDTKNINVRIDSKDKTINISGMLMFMALIKNESNAPSAIEKEAAFEYSISCDKITQNSTADIKIDSVDCTYTLTDSDGIAVKADIKICGELYSSSFYQAVTDVSVDDSRKITRDGDYALKLYYGVRDENVWNIAKKYCTSVNAIIEENSLDTECLSDDGMLLIPIV
ncbi:MAG: DUF3794 domain-containing protein [Ruminococcus sp.]|nr:DUF3794 domain-containing protein [Ruminococcus sp.]